ncbi:MAG: glycoside hydrolase family 3 C-terminal domain-containing protein [Alteraurantiacibacter sp.]
MPVTPPYEGMSVADQTAAIDEILVEATMTEKVAMMSGKGFFKAFTEDDREWCARPYRAGGGIDRLNIPPLYFTDGPRGVAGHTSTCFPCSMARGATFDPDLEMRIGEVMGKETRANGCNFSGAVCINLLRHPAWGRAQETYGEDPHLLGEMGAALATGIQTHNVIASVKHFALNSMENARFKIDVRIGERALHEVYLPHFKRTIDAGCISVMSAYNKMNGEYCGQHRGLLTDILRHEWGFSGFVHSDWVMGVYQPYGAAAGLDIENPEPVHFGAKLEAGVENGTIEPMVIDTACRRILRASYTILCRQDPLKKYGPDLKASPEHIAVALEAAEKSAVLLKNEGVLPLKNGKIASLAVLGRLADLENTGDEGSSKVTPPYVISALEGLKRAANRCGVNTIIHAAEDDLSAAKDAVATSDAVIVVVGNTLEDEGEYIPGDIALGADVPEELREQKRAQVRGGDRTELGIRSDQRDLIAIAAASGKSVVVVMVSGSAIMVEEWHGSVGAILQTFYSGMEGGTALAKLLFGEISPSGKLPFTVARNSDDYPFFDKDADAIDYNLFHGYSLFDRDGTEPRYAFGHGLSYASFAYSALRPRRSGERLQVEVCVTNTGAVAADEVVQVYIGVPGQAVERQHKLLKGFKRIRLDADETRNVMIDIALDDLRWRDPETHGWRFEPGSYTVHAGGASDQLIQTDIIL